MPGPKTNEREGTRAVLRYFHMSASKARVVLDLIRGEDVNTAREILALTEREAADVIGKLLASAVANAVNNDGLAAEDLYVAAAYADEGPTMKRFSPRARGRAGRIKKRSTHITIIVARMDEARLEHVRAARNAQAVASRGRRVASSRRRADQTASLNRREAAAVERAEAEAAAEHEHDETTEIVETDQVDDAVAETENETVDVAVDETVEPTDETASEDATEETDK
jgi:large subunit ribosomal protein L22